LSIDIIHFVTSDAARKEAASALRIRARAAQPAAVRDKNSGRRGRLMARNGTSLEAAHASVKQLIAEKLKYLVPMTIIFMVGYIGLTILAGFARDLMGTKVIGSLNLGFTLIAFNYLLSWVLAIVYGRIAAEKFDPLAARAAMEISGRGN
jgi:uncharacterized membrane protein (DUF485 family)